MVRGGGGRAALLVGQQLIGDSAGTLSDVVETSITQSIVDGRVPGRVNATVGTVSTLLQLAGTVGGGVVAEAMGLRAAMWLGVVGGVAGVLFVWASPVRAMREVVGSLPVTALPIKELLVTE